MFHFLGMTMAMSLLSNPVNTGMTGRTERRVALKQKQLSNKGRRTLQASADHNLPIQLDQGPRASEQEDNVWIKSLSKDQFSSYASLAFKKGDLKSLDGLTNNAVGDVPDLDSEAALIETRFKGRSRELSPLCFALLHHDMEFTEKALSMGANVNGNEFTDITPVMCARAVNFEQGLIKLLNNGAKPDFNNFEDLE